MAWIVRAALAALLLTMAGLALSKPATECVNVSFTLASPITLNEPVFVDVLIENGLTRATTIDLGWKDQGFFAFKVVTPDHKEIYMSSGAPKDELGWRIARHLKPEEQYSARFLLNKWFSFDRAGTYKILAKSALVVLDRTPIPCAAENHAYFQVIVKETILDLTILPRNEAVLKERCDTLLREVTKGRGVHRIRALEELSYITDPIAIPYLIKLAEDMEEGAAIRGLTRIGTDEAMEAMIVVTKSEYDKRRAASAKAILRKKLPQIRDPEIRKKVMEAIE